MNTENKERWRIVDTENKEDDLESSRLEEIEKRLKYLERRFDNLIMTLKLEFYEG